LLVSSSHSLFAFPHLFFFVEVAVCLYRTFCHEFYAQCPGIKCTKSKYRNISKVSFLTTTFIMFSLCLGTLAHCTDAVLCLIFSVRLFGSYEALEGGMTNDALVDFTGGISYRVDLMCKHELPQDLFTRLQTQDRMSTLMSCSINVCLLIFVVVVVVIVVVLVVW